MYRVEEEENKLHYADGHGHSRYPIFITETDRRHAVILSKIHIKISEKRKPKPSDNRHSNTIPSFRNVQILDPSERRRKTILFILS